MAILRGKNMIQQWMGMGYHLPRQTHIQQLQIRIFREEMGIPEDLAVKISNFPQRCYVEFKGPKPWESPSISHQTNVWIIADSSNKNMGFRWVQ